jgi:hypothetical protein
MTKQEKDKFKEAFPFPLSDEWFEPMTREEFEQHMKFPNLPEIPIEEVTAHLCPGFKNVIS